MEKVYVGIAMHPQAEETLKKQVEITHDPGELTACSGAIVYSPEDAWADREDTKNLRAVGCHAYDEKIGQWARGQGVHMTEAASLWRTVAEHTLALLMAAARSIPAADRDIRAGKWRDNENLKVLHSGRDFQGRTLGIFGLGQIGVELAQMVRGFRMKVLYNDLAPNPTLERELGLEFVSLPDLLSRSDYFCVLVPLNEHTRGMLGEAELKLLKPGCVWVNTARGPIAEEQAFLHALEDGRIGAAGLDVYWEEPLPGGHPLAARENVVLTPHLGGSTLECDMVLVDGVLRGLGLL